MSNSEIESILNPKGIEISGNISFKNNESKIAFLNKIEAIYEKDIKLDIINQDIVEIINELTLTENTFYKLKRINWKDFKDMIEHQDNKRKEKIYNNFIEFLQSELKVKIKKNEENHDNLHVEHHFDSTEKKDKKDLEVHNSIFEKKEDFDVEEDLKQKAEKFGVNVKFDYTVKPGKITVNDFTLYFNKRLEYFTKLLSTRSEVDTDNILRISQLQDFNDTNEEVAIIGLISEISETRNGHFMISIEDKSGQINCFVNKKKSDLVEKIEEFCLDEGIAVVGKMGNKIVWVDDLITPAPPNSFELKKTAEEHYLCFISDIHFGANVFQDEAFQKFLDFLNGETQSEQLNKIAKKVKYVLVPGDIIEGIGIYPGQGQDARILSTELQYHEAARWLSQIPKDKGIIVIPGNHDTDRLSEPQPKLPYEKAYALYNLENLMVLSNPSIVKLFEDDISGGLEIYQYHGGSFFYYADKIKKLREKGGAKAPEEVVKYLLEKRHLAPSHGATLYIPDSQNDTLIIKNMPDFFVTGHTHKLALSNYKGCTIVSCGCWVEMSDYQEKMGMYPDVGKAIIVNTKTRKPHILNFYTEEYKKKDKEN